MLWPDPVRHRMAIESADGWRVEPSTKSRFVWNAVLSRPGMPDVPHPLSGDVFADRVAGAQQQLPYGVQKALVYMDEMLLQVFQYLSHGDAFGLGLLPALGAKFSVKSEIAIFTGLHVVMRRFFPGQHTNFRRFTIFAGR